MTQNAQYILEIINHSQEHLTAEQIFFLLKEKNSKVVLATVYNNLATLYKNGFIQKVSIEGYPDRYDKATKHDHLVCQVCGKISDISLNDLTQQLQKQIGVKIISYDLKINYICKECRKKEDEN
ncbi:MAG: Fur family transcriptional regulator [Floccifex sp.]